MATSNGQHDTLLVHDSSGIASARRFAVAAAVAAGMSTDRQDDVALATSELVANALDHGGAGEVIVTHGLSVGHLEISVSSTMAGTLPTRATERVAATSIQGRGLGIVAHVCDGVIIEGVSGRVIVRCRFAVAPERVSNIDPPARR